MPILLVMSCVAAVLAGLVHAAVFALQTIAWTSPSVRQAFGISSETEAAATRSLAFTQGFSNLFLAIGAVLGVVLVATGSEAAGWALVVFSCACMLGAALVLAGTGSRFRRSAVAQGVFPLVALLLAFLGSLVAA